MGLEKTQEAHQVDKFVIALMDSSKSLEDRVAHLETNEGISSGRNYAILQDQKTAGTAGGTATAGSWFTRILNMEVYDLGDIVTLASNQFTLGAGIYLIETVAASFNTGRHKTRLRNITDGNTAAVGSSEITGTGIQTRSFLSTIITITYDTVYELQHRVEGTQAVNGQGVESGAWGEIEVYASVKIVKLN